MSLICRCAATLALAFALAGCTVSPPSVSADVAGAPLVRPASRDRDENHKASEEKKWRSTAVSREYNLESEADEQGPPTVRQILRAHAERDAIVRESPGPSEKAAGLQPSQWQALGPSNVAGRVRSLAFDPRNPNRLFAGTATGGIWLTEDGGTSWRANNDFLPNLSATSIVVDAANPDVMYVGTGEATQGFVGVGVFKSFDGGTTWQYVPSTNPDANADWRFVNRLAIHPTQTQVLLAAMTNNNLVTGAIYRSTDAGGSWTRVATMRALDIAFDPNAPSNAVAGLDDGTIAYSRDGGLSWARTAPLTTTFTGRGGTARAEIAFARSQRSLVYASLDNNKGEVWRSNDSGATWAKSALVGHLNVQGDYDNAIWVDPIDANHVVVGGLDLYQSRDGGQTFTQVSDWRFSPSSPHADHHALASPPNFSASRAALYDGNDGGVYMTANIFAVNSGDGAANGWVNANNGLAVTQFYSGAGKTGGRVIGGAQDNGSLMLSQGQWQPFRRGDGGFVAVDPTSEQVFYGEYVYLAIHRATPSGSVYICEGITEAMPAEDGNTYCGDAATKKANFIAPFILDPNNPARIFAGAASLWTADDVRAGTPAWRSIKTPSAAADNFINAIAVTTGNSNAIWVGHNNGELYRTLDGLAAAPTWTRMGQGILPARRVQRITIDRDNPNRVIVALTGFVANNVWQTLDGGITWISVTGNLPQAPVFDVKRHPSNANWLYAATSVGVFTSENGGASWSTTNEGPANIRVRELFWLDNATLGAATFGRGMYKIAVASGGPNNYQDLWWVGPQENGWGMSISQHGSILFVGVYVYDAQGLPIFTVIPGGTWNADFTEYTGSLYISSGSYFANYDVSRFTPGAPVGTGKLTFTSAGTATFSYTINGIAGVKSIQRQIFGPVDATPVATYGDLWWGGTAQNGWGVAISQQYRMLFAVWYTYDADGRPTWYVVSGGIWTAANIYTGTAYRTASSPWLGADYNAAAFNPQPVGTVTFTFTGLNSALMTYNVDGVSGSNPIVRQPF